MLTATADDAGMTALEQIDSRPLTSNQKKLILLVILGNVSEFFDMFLIGFAVSSLLKDPVWHLKGFEAGWILAMSGLGAVIGAIAWGRLADRIGRKAAFSWCVLLFTVFTLASVFTPNDGWIMLAILRIFVGIGVGGLNITSIPYVQEFVPAKQRGLLSGLASVFIPLGLFLGSVAQMIVGSNWRLLISLGALPIFLLL
jgi:putative MFS transporter